MDPFSQASLGAVVGHTVGYRTLGYKAALYGAAAGALPDIDVLFSIGGDFVDQLVTHRGITHSLFFGPVMGPLLGWLIWRREKAKDPTVDERRRNMWILTITLALFSHPLLDTLTPYGTQLMLPFSDARFAIHAMPIIDPVYTLTLALGLFLAWLPWLRRRLPASLHPGHLGLLTLLLSTSYLAYGWSLGLRAEAAAAEQLAARNIQAEQLVAFPTILQPHLRRVVARSPEVDRVGFYSTWAPCEIDWIEAPRSDTSVVGEFLSTRAGSVFDWFTMGWAHYVVTEDDAGKVLRGSDLRYGFDDDPLTSVFTVEARLGKNGELLETMAAGRTQPTNPGAVFDRLVTDTYAPACRLLTLQTEGAIDGRIDDNAADRG